MELSRLRWDRGGNGGGGWLKGILLGEGGVGKAAPGLPLDDGRPARAPVIFIVPQLKPKCVV